MRSKAERLDPALGALVALPPLLIGGAPSWVIPPFATAALAVLAWRLYQAPETRAPRGWPLLAAACMWTVLAALPLGESLSSLVAPGTSAFAGRSLALADAGTWTRISILPGATWLEAGRIAGLLAVFVLAAKSSWRRLAAVVSATGLVVLTLGLLQLAIGSSSLLGLYEPSHVSLEGASYSGIFTTFINPNHYGAFCLLTAASSWALVVDDNEARGFGRDARAFFTVATALNLLGLLLCESRGAILCAALALPFVLTLGRTRAQRKRSKRSPLGVALAVIVLLGLLALAGRDAWTQLRSLGDEGAFVRKFESVVASLELIPGAALTGTGRGTSVDLLGTVFRERGVLVFTHIESAPVAAIVEWGPLVGTALVLGAFWIFAKAWKRARSSGRRVLLIGLAAWALENCADFNWQLLGTTSAAVALLGSLSPRDAHPLSTRARRVLVGSLLLLCASAWLALPDAWSQLRRQDLRVAAQELTVSKALARRPLDARVHLLLARAAHDEKDFERALAHAQFAADVAPWSVDAQTLLAKLHQRAGRIEAAHASLANALQVVRYEEREALVAWLCLAWPPAAMQHVVPARDQAFALAAMELLSACPAHADAFAVEPSRADEAHVVALEVRTRANLSLGRPLLARHYGRLWVAAAPARARAHLWHARTMREDPPDPEGEELSRARLAAALKSGVDEPALLEEAILRSLLYASTPEQRREYLERHGQALLRRPGDRDATQRRKHLVQQVEGRG